MKTVWNVMKKVLGVFCVLMVVGGCVATYQEKQPGLLVLVAVFGLLAVICFRRPKKKQPPVNTTQYGTPEVTITTEHIPEIPKETLKDMRRYYTAMQAQNDARIMAESFQLCQQTHDFDTFFSRLKLAQQSALTLLQAKQARCKGVDDQTVQACRSVLSAGDALKLDFLERKYQHETNSAMQLKTPAGQRKRLEAFLNKLQAYDVEFFSVEDAYNSTVEKIKELVQE